MESKIEKRLRLGVEALGGKCLKFNRGKGNPDRIVMLPSGLTDIFGLERRPVTELVELKDDDDPRSNQNIRIAQFQKMGYRVAVLRDSGAVDTYLENLKQRRG